MTSPTASALPSAGTLSEASPVRLYYLAASSDQTGRLVFQLADRKIDVQFRKGNPEHVSSSHSEDSLSEFLRSQKLVTAEQLGHAEAVLASFGSDLVSALFGLGILNPTTAFARLAEQAFGVLGKALLAESGSFTFEASSLAPAKVMPLGNRWGVLTEIIRKIPAAEIRRRMNGLMNAPFFKSEGRVTLKDLPLTPQETRASTHLDGARTMEHLLKSFPQDGDNLLRLVFLFRELELLAFRDGRSRSEPSAAPSDSIRAQREPSPSQPKPKASPSGSSGVRPEASDAPPEPVRPPPEPIRPPPEPIRPPPEPVRAAQPARPVATEVIRTGKAESSRPPPPVLSPSGKTPPPTRSSPAAPSNPPPKVGPPKTPETPRAEPTPASAQAELVELRARASRLKDENYFQLLKVSEKADAAEIKLAYLKLAKSYHPDTLSLNTSPEVGKLKADIFTAIGEAYRVLSDDNSRANYLEIIKSGGNDELLPLAQVLLAEETFQRGSNLVKAKRFGEAVKVLDEAIKGNPDEGEFYAWRGYAKFFSIEDKRDAQAQAQRDLQLAVQKNPKCAPAYYFLGHIAKLGGDKHVALKHFRRAVEIKPDYIDAKREVRMLSTKK